MDPDLDSVTKRSARPDDEALGTLVRAAADEWTLPPQRLDQPTWRDRIDGRPARRSGRGWFARLAGPPTVAVVGTVVLAFVAVLLTGPRTGPAIADVSPSASGARPGAVSSQVPAASTLPELFRDGALPDPAQVMVRTVTGYRIADLATGRLGEASTGRYDGPSTLFARPGGGWLCVCGDWVAFSGNRPTGLDVLLETADANGVTLGQRVLRSIQGDSDPGTGGTAQPELADVRAVAAADGRTVFVGWTVRHGAAGWSGGIDVVDVDSATVVGSAPLTFGEPAAADGRLSTRIAPVVAVAPSGDTILVSSLWWADTGMANVQSGIEHWTASFDGRRIGSLVPAGASHADRCQEVDQGLIDAASYYVTCWTPDGHFVVERYRLDGTAIAQTPVAGMTTGIDGHSPVVRHGDALFMWDAYASQLSRFDLRSGAVESATAVAPGSTSDRDLLAALSHKLGRWLAPSVLAKMLLDPGLAISPDGTRVYAIGIDAVSGADEDGSSGVFVFDAAAMTQLDHWQPTADFTSLALSADGRSLYATGLPGRDAAGMESDNGASITVYDTADGSVRLIAGALGSTDLFFPGSTAR